MCKARVIGWKLLLLWIACGGGTALGAEGPAKVRDFVLRTWGKEHGLPDAPVTAILQTRDTYLWVGTSAGLFRFDGVWFTEMPLGDFVPRSPVSITTMCEDHLAQLWIGSQEHGLFCLKEDKVKHYRKADGLLDDAITSLTMNTDGGLWIGTQRGLNLWDGKAFAAFTRREGLPDEVVTSVHAAPSGAVWVTTRGGMCRAVKGKLEPFEFPSATQGRNPEFLGAYEDPRSNLWVFGASYLINLTESKRFNYFHGEEPASVRIWSLCAGREGRLWIGTSARGLFWFDGNKFQPAIPSAGDWPKDVRAICEDKDGNLWLGVSEAGLARLRPQSYTLLQDKQGLPAGPASCLGLDPLSRVVVALESGGLFVNQGDRFESVVDGSGLLAQDLVSCLAPGTGGSLWVGTVASGLHEFRSGRTLRLTTRNGLSDDRVCAVCTDADGFTWIGTHDGGLHRSKDGKLVSFSAADGWTGGAISTIEAASRDGGVWIGTVQGQLFRGKQGVLRAMTAGRRLGGKSILGIYEDRNGRLWAGTTGGLVCMQEGNVRLWGKLEGLPDDVVSGVVGDADGNLWLLTGKGICSVPRIALAHALAMGSALEAKLVIESSASGNKGRQFAGGTRAVRSPDGRLWFATTDGLVALDPEAGFERRSPPPVYIEEVLVNGQTIGRTHLASSPAPRPTGLAPASVFRTPATLRALDIRFTALNLSAPEKVRFRHKLESFDPDWVDTGTERRVRYGGVSPGRYVFRVTACNSDGAWNEQGASFAFIVPTPMWRTPGMLALYFLSAMGGGVGLVRLVSHRRLRRKLARLEHQQAMEKERVRIAQDMHDEIGSKLTKISFLSERAKVELQEKGPVTRKIDSIALTSREVLKALDEIVWAVNPRNDTLEHLAAYLAQHAAEYFQNTSVECALRLHGQMPKQAMSADVRHNLFLAFEECLNNVLKHAGASQAKVDIKIEQGRFEIEVVDNGRGFAPSPLGPPAPPRGGNGLVNMRLRLADIGGQCVIQSSPGKGTAVRFSIALNPIKPEFL